MYSVERVIRNVKGVDKETKMVFGTGRLSNNPPEIVVKGENSLKVMQGSKEHPFAIAFPDQSLGKDDQGRTKSKFFNATAFDKTAELLARLGFKGQEIEVVGRIETNHYQGKDYDTLVIERFEVKKYKPKSGDASPTGENSNANPADSTSAKDQSSEKTASFEGGSQTPTGTDDDIPF